LQIILKVCELLYRTFLGRDHHGRPPIIFEVEEYKALTTTSPDSASIASKIPVHSSKNSAEKVSKSPTNKTRLDVTPTPSLTAKSSKSPELKRWCHFFRSLSSWNYLPSWLWIIEISRLLFRYSCLPNQIRWLVHYFNIVILLFAYAQHCRFVL